MHCCINCEGFRDTIEYPKAQNATTDGNGVTFPCKGYNLGWLDSVIKLSALCSLCMLVTRLWERVSLEDTIVFLDEDTTCPYYKTSSGPQRIYVWIAHSDRVYLTSSGQRRNWIFEVVYCIHEANDHVEVVATIPEPRISLLVDDLLSLRENDTDNIEYLYLGRARSSQHPDWNFLQSCFDECKSVHGSPCREAVANRKSEMSRIKIPLVRFIDVKENCIVESAPSKISYAILSYVWGTSNSLTLTSSNVGQLMIPGTFAHVDIPKTIAQAMEATVSLGLRYIWVDSVCILQDSQSDKAILLPLMGDLYAGASVTIVDAGSDSANGGLWTSRQDQIIEEVDGLHFLVVEPAASVYLEASSWFTRGWTYQEMTLSRRLLLFTQNCAYFLCKSAAYSEDSVQSMNLKGNSHQGYGPEDTHVTVIHGPDYTVNFPVEWRNLIIEYSRRNLTYQIDALNAALGVITKFHESDGLGTMCGLAVLRLFEYGLLWVPTKQLQRRVLSGGNTLPTWTWLGWVGQITYEDLDDGNDIDDRRTVHSWQLLSTNGAEIACWEKDEGIRFVNAQPEQKSNIQSPDALDLINTGILDFCALTAKFDVARQPYSQLTSSKDQSCEFSGVYKISSAGVWVGGVHLERRSRDYLYGRQVDAIADTDTCCDFIVLSKSAYPPWLLDHRANPNVLSIDDESLPVCDLELIGEDYEEWDMYNVMLIQHHTHQDTTTRIGIGQILQKSFDTAKPVMRNVRLA